MEKRVPRIILMVFFLGLLATPAVVSRMTAGRSSARGADPARAISQFGFRLAEVSKSAGIRFTHQAPKLDSRLDPIMPQVSSMGAGVSVVDFDRDGWEDMYVTNSGEGSKNHLYRNRGDGSFEEVGERMGVADVNRPDSGVSMGAVWGDYDNDGYEDLFVYKWGRPELFHNDGGRRFTRVTDGAGLPHWVNANTAVWVDYDRDGHLDLFLCGYYDERINLWQLKDTKIMPESFEYARNGGRKYLLRNRGNIGGGTASKVRFDDVTAEAGINSRRWALAVVAADLRGTGYPDLIIANDYGVSEYFANEGGKRFREIGRETGIGERPKSGMNACLGDIQNQGRPAIYISNISEEGVLIQGNNLWVPVEMSANKIPYYANMAEGMGVELGGWSFGAQFGDLNNDGNLDLFCTNGYISANKDRSYWYDFAKVAGGNTAIISDARNWPPIEDMSLSGYQAKRLWVNDGAGRFLDVAAQVGVTERFDGRAVAMADFWNRGVLDIVVSHQKGPVLLYKNEVAPERRWIEFALEGSKSNRSAIGATVRAFWGGKQQVQYVAGASGFCAQNGRRLHFGLGETPTIDKVVIQWPSGQEQTIDAPKVGQIHRIKEPV